MLFLQTESVGRVVFDRLQITDLDEGDNAVVELSCYIPERDEDVSTDICPYDL